MISIQKSILLVIASILLSVGLYTWIVRVQLTVKYKNMIDSHEQQITELAEQIEKYRNEQEMIINNIIGGKW